MGNSPRSLAALLLLLVVPTVPSWAQIASPGKSSWTVNPQFGFAAGLRRRGEGTWDYYESLGYGIRLGRLMSSGWEIATSYRYIDLPGNYVDLDPARIREDHFALEMRRYLGRDRFAFLLGAVDYSRSRFPTGENGYGMILGGGVSITLFDGVAFGTTTLLGYQSLPLHARRYFTQMLDLTLRL